MMKQAVNDILDCVPVQGIPVTLAQLRAKTQALEWLHDEEDSTPTSFRGLCNMLGLEPWEILERLEQKIEEKQLECVLPKEKVDSINTLQGEATLFLTQKLKSFGHMVTVQVFVGGNISCSDKRLIPICKSILGMRYK